LAAAPEGTREYQIQEMKKMKTRILLITTICAVLLIALALPAMADDSAPAAVQPPATVSPADSASFDPAGSFMGLLGLRQDIRARQAEDRNLSQDIQANQEEIHTNWWENIGIFKNILGNRETVRSARQDELANRQENIGLRQDIQDARLDIKNNPDNKTVDLQQIAGDKNTLHGNWQENNATHSTIHEERDLSRQNWSAVHTIVQEDITLRNEDNVSRGEIQTNREQIARDRQQIRNERKNGSSAGSS
jgi:hypothetical protein